MGRPPGDGEGLGAPDGVCQRPDDPDEPPRRWRPLPKRKMILPSAGGRKFRAQAGKRDVQLGQGVPSGNQWDIPGPHS